MGIFDRFKKKEEKQSQVEATPADSPDEVTATEEEAPSNGVWAAFLCLQHTQVCSS